MAKNTTTRPPKQLRIITDDHRRIREGIDHLDYFHGNNYKDPHEPDLDVADYLLDIVQSLLQSLTKAIKSANKAGLTIPPDIDLKDLQRQHTYYAGVFTRIRHEQEQQQTDLDNNPSYPPIPKEMSHADRVNWLARIEVITEFIIELDQLLAGPQHDIRIPLQPRDQVRAEQLFLMLYEMIRDASYPAHTLIISQDKPHHAQLITQAKLFDQLVSWARKSTTIDPSEDIFNWPITEYLQSTQPNTSHIYIPPFIPN